MRDGQRKDVQITPSEGQNALELNGDRMVIDGDRLRERLNDLGRLTDRALPFNFNGNGGTFSFQMPQSERGPPRRGGRRAHAAAGDLLRREGRRADRLGQRGLPASRAGLKAGDVVIKINNEPVRSREDLTRLVGDVKDGGDVTIVIVRDKKESSVTAKLEPRRPVRRGQPA